MLSVIGSMSNKRKCLYSGVDGKYVTMNPSPQIPDHVTDFTTTSFLRQSKSNNSDDYSRRVPDTTPLLTIVIASSTLAFFLIVAVIVACASHKKKQKIRREESEASDNLKVTQSSESQQTDSKLATVEIANSLVCVDIENQDVGDEQVSCCARLCCISRSSDEPVREEHIYSEVESTSITNLPETPDLDGIYDTIDGKGSRSSAVEVNKPCLKPTHIVGCLKDDAVYSHLIAPKSGESTGNTNVGTESTFTTSPTETATVVGQGLGSSEYDHLDYSPRTPPTQSNNIYTFDDVCEDIGLDTGLPRFVIKEETSPGQTENSPENHGYFVLECQKELDVQTSSRKSLEVIVLNPFPATEDVQDAQYSTPQALSDKVRHVNHEYFIVEPSCGGLNGEAVTRPPLPPRNRTYRVSLHGDCCISGGNQFGTNSNVLDEHGGVNPCDRSFSLDSSLVSDTKDIRALDDFTIIHIPAKDVPVQPEVVPIRMAKSPEHQYFTTEPQSPPVTSFGICQALHRSTSGETPTGISPTLVEDSSRVCQDHDFTVRLRDGELRKTQKCDVRRPVSFSSNEYIKRAFRPKPFFEKFRGYDSASLVHRELLGIVRAHQFGKTRSSSDSTREITISENMSTNL